jgi:nucleoside-diphosphate-sugar epimerase
MKVVIIGASGLIGQAIAQALSAKHEIVQVARSKGDYQVDDWYGRVDLRVGSATKEATSKFVTS